MRELAGFAALADEYDGFVLDLWGVIHDGVRAFPEAVDVLRRLRGAGKRCVLLSNAPRRAAAVEGSMRRMGLSSDLWDGIVTSGEVTHQSLRDRPDGWWRALGDRVFHLGPERDRNVMDGLDLTRVDAPEDATFVLNTGPDDHADDPALLGDAARWRPVLERCAAARVPMVCANPDLTIAREGRIILCAGFLAEMYRELGGEARDVGKPDAAVYAPVMAMLGLSRERVLAVGDSLRTDIAGAAGAGLVACWVLGGIHANEVAVGGADRVIPAGLPVLATVPAFRW